MDENEPVDSTYSEAGDAPDGAVADAPAGLIFTCPSCSESIQLAEAPANGLVECPACGAQFFAATDPADIEAEARAQAEAEAAIDSRAAELSELHVRQVATIRRSVMRTRGYFVTGAWACAFAVMQLAWQGTLKVREIIAYKAAGGHVGIAVSVLPISEAVCIVAAVFGSIYCFRCARTLAEELKATVMKDPETPPDLSTLGGGIEQWRGLEQMHEQADSQGQGEG